MSGELWAEMSAKEEAKVKALKQKYKHKMAEAKVGVAINDDVTCPAISADVTCSLVYRPPWVSGCGVNPTPAGQQLQDKL